MSVNIEALYIYDDQRPVLQHVYSSRPPSAQELFARFTHDAGLHGSVLHCPDLIPPTTIFSVTQSGLLFLCPCHQDEDALAIFEFLYKVIDIFEDFLGAPLLASKIEDNYEVVAQILGELCDGGTVCNTESNALRENVEVSTVLGKLFTQVGLSGSSPALGPSSSLSTSLKPTPSLNSGPAIPWRRPNVRHTSNELYVDVVENLSVILAPSGRPICASVSGSMLFTAKISGVPDLLLYLSAPGGTSAFKSAGISRTMQSPTFHPCVRLTRWKEHPGELSFVPPDGRFMLASYDVDLMPSELNVEQPPSSTEQVFLPASAELRSGLGPSGSEFEARLTSNNDFPGVASSSKPGPGRSSGPNPFSFGAAATGSSNAPTLEAVVVTIPFPSSVRSVIELKPSRGEANFNIPKKIIEWKIPTKDGASVNGTAVLTGTVLGPINVNEDMADGDGVDKAKANTLDGYYDEDSAALTQQHQQSSVNDKGTGTSTSVAQLKQTNMTLMPRSIAVSFVVRGWLPSGIRVDSLVVDVKKSKGLGEGVKPFKGVKYVTVSKQGVESRVSQM